MNFNIFLPILLFFLLPTKMQGSTDTKLYSVCESFTAGEIDAYKTLEDLKLDLNDYSIGVNNTAKIFCT